MSNSFENISEAFLKESTEKFKGLKLNADKALNQLSFEELNHKVNEESNSIAITMKHISGNMISRWTDFLTSDGEKPNRNRDAEFEGDFNSLNELLTYWEKGWNVLFNTLASLKGEDTLKTVYIRGEAHSVLQALIRQISHYAYHVGQIVYLAKEIKNTDWKNLTIPKGQSNQFNQATIKNTK